MAIKNLICSRKVVDVANRLGHSASYVTIEELGSKLTFEAIKEKRLTPNGMSLNPATNIGVATDNSGRYVQTVTGKNALHVSLRSVNIYKNTVGIPCEASTSATEESADFQAEYDQEVE